MKLMSNENTAKGNEPIYDSRNSDALRVGNQLMEQFHKLWGLAKIQDYQKSEWTTLQAQLAELQRDKQRLEEALNRIGFYFAGTEHQHVADKVLSVLGGASIDSDLVKGVNPLAV